jgi:ABC-2 type transport system permease protein
MSATTELASGAVPSGGIDPEALTRLLDVAPPRPRSPLATWWSDTLVFAARNLEHIRQIPEKLLDVTLQPIMFVLLFSFVFGGAIAVTGGTYREYLMGGIIIQSLTFGLNGPATSMANDLTEGIVDRFRSLPARRSAYLSGHFVAELAGLTLSIVILLVAGLIVGWRVQSSPLEFLLAIVLLLAYSAAMVWIGTWIGVIVRSADAVMGIAFTIVFPLTFVSNAFVPIQTMPKALQYFAVWNPVSVLVQATRELFGNPTTPTTLNSWPLEHAVPAAFAYCAILLAVAVPMALRRYRARTSD